MWLHCQPELLNKLNAFAASQEEQAPKPEGILGRAPQLTPPFSCGPVSIVPPGCSLGRAVAPHSAHLVPLPRSSSLPVPPPVSARLSTQPFPLPLPTRSQPSTATCYPTSSRVLNERIWPWNFLFGPCFPVGPPVSAKIPVIESHLASSSLVFVLETN